MTIRASFRPAALVCVALAGCGKEPGPAPAAGAVAAPIDCPLRAKGIDPHGLEPFEKTAEYIAFLERPDRATWQRPDAVVAALGLDGSETVADVGAGSGYFTFRLAAVLPKGRVIAADVRPEMVRHIHHRAMSEGVANVQVVLVDPGDPEVSSEVDVVFICDVLHHVKDRAAWLERLAAPLRAGARLVVIEFKEGELPQGPPAALKTPRADLLALLKGAGFRLVAEKPELLPYQCFLIFEKSS